MTHLEHTHTQNTNIRPIRHRFFRYRKIRTNMVTRFGKKTTETPAPEVWSYEAIESDDETDQSGGMEEDSEHPRLSPASDFFHQKKGSRHGAG